MIAINISEQYTETPGHRSPTDGPFSGDDFREKWLKPKYLEARQQGTKLHINLDGTAGYATSFLEAAFGGLAREFPIDEVLETLEFSSDDEPYLPTEIREYIAEARDE